VERSGKFYAKLKLDDVPGAKQQKLFGQSTSIGAIQYPRARFRRTDADVIHV
jgi:hypothetical protein